VGIDSHGGNWFLPQWKIDFYHSGNWLITTTEMDFDNLNLIFTTIENRDVWFQLNSLLKPHWIINTLKLLDTWPWESGMVGWKAFWWHANSPGHPAKILGKKAECQVLSIYAMKKHQQNQSIFLQLPWLFIHHNFIPISKVAKSNAYVQWLDISHSVLCFINWHESLKAEMKLTPAPFYCLYTCEGISLQKNFEYLAYE